MRGTQAGDTGEVGEAAANWKFSRTLQWPAVQSSRRELGTDLWVETRARRFPHHTLIGVQAKSGDSWFARPHTDSEGAVDGWWFRDDANHFDYWLDHSVPHLIVLHEPETDCCYWVHVTSAAVERTAKGGKILVPRSQTICADDRDALLAVAATAKPAVPLEGTAWTGAPPVAAADLLRYALIAPRVIAPHPNRGTEPQTPAEGIALIVQRRGRHVWPIAGHSAATAVPEREEARAHKVWGWRFAVALDDWMRTQELTAISECRASAPTAAEHTAVTVMIAHARVVAGDPRSALDIVDHEIARDRAAPVDHAWLHLQRARALFELGDLANAKSAAAVALPIGQTARPDLTASAISGTASAVAFNADWRAGSIGAVIEANDTAVGWWRGQTMLTAAVAQLEDSSWRALDGGGAPNEWHDADERLLAASTQAGLLGSQGQWCHGTRLRGRLHLQSTDRRRPGSAEPGLRLLRQAGDEVAIKRAAAWVLDQGPAADLAACAAEVDFSRATATTMLADLALLDAGADLVDASIAVAAVDWLLSCIENPAQLKSRTPFVAYDRGCRVIRPACSGPLRHGCEVHRG